MAREIRILHTADTHLGYRQYHSEARRKDFFAAFELVVNDAVEMQVDAVVHAGDLFDSRNPTLEDLLETMNILARLKEAGIPFLGIVGNHESKQNIQWLDLFEEMGLAVRLGKKPFMVGNAAIYGIDSVPKSKIPIFDYSGFEAPDSSLSTLSNPSTPEENFWKLLVMHQIVNPFPYAEWDCDEVLENLPFKVDAILLGDYHEHAIIKNKTGETWITYSGSTERNAVSEKEARSYNIITLSEKGLEISRRTIPTRNFLSIQVELNGEDNPYEQIFSKVNEHLEEIPGSVVFLEIIGDSGPVLSQSELEEYLINKKAIVANVKDWRTKESFPEEALKITFSDPDHAVASEIRKMSLNDGGLIINEVVRSPDISKSRVDEETESRLSKLIEAKAEEFKSPDFRIEVPASPISPASSTSDSGFSGLEELKPSGESEPDKNFRSAMEIGFAGKAEFSGETGLSGKTRPIEVIAGKLEITELSGVLRTSDLDEKTKMKSVSQPVSQLHETKLASKPESELPDNEPGKEAQKPSEFAVNSKSQEETSGKSEKLTEEKPARATGLTRKAGKAGQKKGKSKSAVPRQYNLGDYL
ncbi:MAG: metallophosphoesterase [Methanosarcina thermophila]